jgi:hypothetical protein
MTQDTQMLDIINRLLSQKTGQKERLEYLKHVIESQRELEKSDKDFILSHSITKQEVKEKPIPQNISKDGCTLCQKKLGMMNKKSPEKIWEIDGKICKDCYKEVRAGVNVFDATYKEGVSFCISKTKGKLIIHNHKAKKQISFISEKPPVKIIMPKEKITSSEKIQFEKGTKMSNFKSKLGKDSKSTHIHIQYQDTLTQNPIFEIKELERAVKEIDYLRLRS